MIRILLAALLGVVALVPAKAGQQQRCPGGQFCIVDAKGSVVGLFISINAGLREYNGTWYLLNVDRNGVEHGTAGFLYTSTDCSGSAYLPIGTLLPNGTGFDQNGFLWTVNLNAQTVITPLSFNYSGICYQQSSYPIYAGPAVLLDAAVPPTWVPPFSVIRGGRPL